MRISGKTRVIALIGYPVGQSLSPAMHNSAFERLGLDYCYVALPVRPEDLRDAVRGTKALDFAGANVTVPHKENVIPLLDEVDKEASLIGAVNTVVNKDGRLIGYNTDGRGFMQGLAEEGIEPGGRNILIIGAGGASRAIGHYLSEKAGRLFLYDIDRKKAGRLASDLGKTKGNVGVKDAPDTGGMDIVINATPLGLKETDPLPFDVSALKPSQTVGDLIYKETPLLGEAKRKGCKTFSGLGMLLWQGVFAFELWTGVKPPVDVMKKALPEE